MIDTGIAILFCLLTFLISQDDTAGSNKKRL